MTAVLKSFSQSANQTVSPISHTIPAGWSAGDLVIAFLWTQIRTVKTPPGNWNPIDTGIIISGGNSYAFWKLLDAEDLGSSPAWTLNANPGAGSRILLCRITGHEPTTPIVAGDGGADDASVMTHILPSLTTPVDDCLLIHAFPQHDQALTGGAGAGAVAFGQTNNQSIYGQTVASAGPTGTGTYTTGANRRLPFFSIAVAPGEGGGGGEPGALIFRHHFIQYGIL